MNFIASPVMRDAFVHHVHTGGRKAAAQNPRRGRMLAASGKARVEGTRQ